MGTMKERLNKDEKNRLREKNLWQASDNSNTKF